MWRVIEKLIDRITATDLLVFELLPGALLIAGGLLVVALAV